MAGSVDILAQRLLQTQTRLNYQERATKGVRTGTIVSIDDPDNRGRALVLMDTENQNYVGAGVESQNTSQTYWVNSVPAFIGKLPETMKGQRVVLHTGNNDEGQLFIQDVVRDGMDGDDPAYSSTMTRLPLYPSGSLPKPERKNLGCMVIELDGPMDSDWVCVCLRRKGGYMWVRHSDLSHGHAGQNDDKGSDCENSVWDFVFPTSHCSMEKTTTCEGPCPDPRPNPFGSEATWYPPPMCIIDPPPCDSTCFPPPPPCPEEEES